MTNPVISAEHLSKVYRLGQIGTGTFTNDLKVWWARTRGKPNPLLKIGQVDHGSGGGEELWALRDINFTLDQGEVLGVIGRNGAGKSTLLKVLSRVTAPSEGLIRVKGRIASLLEVGTGFHPELTGRENIYLNGAILGMKRREIDRKFDEIVDFAEVEKFIDTPVKRYSSGMYVRLAFAVAAHLDSEILIVDEVLAVGDAEFQKKCIGKMGDVAAQEGRTVLFVSHNMASIENLCTRALLLKSGQISDSGPTDIVVNAYLNGTNQSQLVYDLTDKSIPRRGSGDVRFSKISLMSDTGENLSQIKITQAININMEIYGFRSIKNLEVGVAIFDKKSNRLCGLNSRDINDFQFSIDQGETKTLICRIPEQNLAPGVYNLNFIIRSQGKEVHDYIEQICSFEVVASNYYGTGKLPAGENIILLKADWKLT